MHLLPALILWLDVMTSASFPAGRIRAISYIIGFTMTYGLWIHLCFYMNGFWVYPFLGVMSPLQRISFIAGASASAIGLYFISMFFT